ncbi:Heterokaryon incompatibility protein 6 [Colletotrichum gloeosporioides]|uniref:Heterokaryon incompatibility protein 6 n=1 Tax=Colletotrichum gloeosporioides TaxID=474922 RepID=A0A8H4CMK6_COLGL|nr:Heterokaryon incompatibility protein 6 [Colletotrichum gloeosporioides]KAF3806651.1 Heterokaryon incompatibility protein 6 [Colletotrichum gloeosporioides]
MSSYNYQPIDPNTNTIRLLRLFQGRRYYNDELICGELFEAEIPHDRDDTYEALSYTWGDPTRTKTIAINDQKVAVTTNLYNALLHLRDPEKDRILWVDALCINQQDAFERTHQVAKMSVIYQKAWAVVIWLGKTTRDIELLLEATKALDKVVRGRPRPSSNAEHLKSWIDEGRRFISEKRAINPDFYEIRQRAMKELLSRSWFRRVWVVQEAAYAKTAYIQCSWISVPTRVFCMMPHLLDIDMDARSQALLEVLPGPLRQSSWWNDTRDLSNVLQKFSSSESTDPRDQIFALLGLSSDCAKDGRVFLPNYELNTLECIQQTLFFLAFREIPVSDLFSLPDWDLETFRQKLPSLRLCLLEWGISQNDNGVPLVRKLLREGPRFENYQQVFSDELPLSYLISNGKPMEMIQIFLEHDDLDARQAKNGLSHAASFNRIDLTQMFLGREDADILYNIQDIKSALECAMHSQGCDVAEALLSAVRHRKGGLSQVYEGLLLYRAVKSGNTRAITMLVQNGVPPDIPIPHDEGTAMLAATDYERTEALKVLARLGVDINEKGVFETPISSAAKGGNLESVTCLLGLGVRLPAAIVADCTYWWTNRGCRPGPETAVEMVELLASKGVNLEIKNPFGWNALLLAISAKDRPMVELLIRLGVNLEVVNQKGKRALLYAVELNHVIIARLLVKAMAALQEGLHELPAFYAAILLGENKVVRFLGDRVDIFTMPEEVRSSLPNYVFENWSEERWEIDGYLRSREVDLLKWTWKQQERDNKRAREHENRPVKRKKMNHTYQMDSF